jgi:hypothetical protein
VTESDSNSLEWTPVGYVLVTFRIKANVLGTI